MYLSIDTVFVLDDIDLFLAGLDLQVALDDGRLVVQPARNDKTTKTPRPYEDGNGRGDEERRDQDEQRDTDPEEREGERGAKREEHRADAKRRKEKNREKRKEQLRGEK